MAYLPNDDNRKFTELYGVHRLKSGSIPKDNHVYISTIQRFYSILKGEELDESAEETHPGELRWDKREPVPVVYNPAIPSEFFDFVFIDECHRSIYNLWKQVLDYFDSFLTGLTATPDNRTFGFFNQNIVSEYTHEQAVADGVNVGYDVYGIETEITRKGSVIWKGEYVDHREKLTRKRRWEMLDEDLTYSAKQLDNEVVNPNQIRLIIKTFREHLPTLFPDRFIPSPEGEGRGGVFEVPKTLIFAKTDVRPLECLLFLRDVKSRNYFEQMKGRGTRTISLDDLRKVTPSAKFTKDHFVIVDAIGVTRSLKTDSRPLEKKPGIPLKDLLGAIAVGVRDEDLFTTLAGRLARLDKQATDRERELFREKSGKTISRVVGDLLRAWNPDTLEAFRMQVEQEHPGASPLAKEEVFGHLHKPVLEEAASVFTGGLNQFIEEVRRTHTQVIDHINPDRILYAGWDKANVEHSGQMIRDFREWIESHREEITALQIFYAQPYRRRELTYHMIRDLYERMITDRPSLAPLQVWRAYDLQGKTSGSPRNELIALVSLVRHACGIDAILQVFDSTVDRNFREWVFRKQAGALKFTEEQMHWLRMIKEYVAASFHIGRDDFDLSPFNAYGGLGRMYQLFGEQTEELIEELNEALAA